MDQSALRVLVVEDERLVADDECAVLTAAGYFALPPVTAARAAESAVETGRPDVVLVDIALDRGNDGLALGARLRSRFGVPIVIVSAHSDPSTLKRAAAIAPDGFVVKPFIPEQLVATVTAALSRTASNRNAAGPAPTNGERREDALDRRGANVRGLDLLTPRERDVLEALLTGRRIRGIAAARGLSTHTVRNHVKAILFKLEVHSQEELIALFADRV